MRTSSRLHIVAATAAALALSACGQSQDGTTSAPEAPAVETAEQVVARIAASMTPADFKLREVQCMQTLNTARMDIDDLPADAATRLEATPRMDFFKLIEQTRELGLTSDQVNAKQHDQLKRPGSPEDVTPEYLANLNECLLIAEVANARDGVTQ